MAGRRWLLLLIIGVALVRGLFWAVITEVPNPVDEIHHLAYIDSLARGNGIPVVGVDHLSSEILKVMRESPTSGYRDQPSDPAKPQEWGVAAHQYEAVQPPLYYLAMVPAYVAGRAAMGVVGSLYAVRLATVLLALTTLPIAWLLARTLFPDRPSVWGFSALLLALLQGFNSNLASVTNDALVVPLAAASALVFARTVPSPTWRGAVGCGLIIGAAMLAKLNAVALVPILAIALLVLPPREGKRSLWQRTAWGLAAVGVAVAVASAWFLWNLSAYGKLSGGSDRAAEMLSALQPTYPFSVTGVKTHLAQSQSGFWQFQRFYPYGPGEHGRLYLIAAVLALLGTALAMSRGRRQEGRRLVWLALCLPLAFLSMLAIVYLAYTGTIVGRHTYIALVPLLLFLTGGILLGFGRHLGALALAVLIAASLWQEQTEFKRYLHQIYLTDVVQPGVAPVWEQPFSYFWVPTTRLRVQSACPVMAIGVGVFGQPPPQIAVVTAGGTKEVDRLPWSDGFGIYLSDRPLPTTFDVAFSAPVQLGAAVGVPGRVRFAEEESTTFSPLTQLQCKRPDWEQLRFSQRFEPLHPNWITLGGALGWTRGWAVGGILFSLAVAGVQLRDWGRTRKNRPDEPRVSRRP